jgi:hypothetical protein
MLNRILTNILTGQKESTGRPSCVRPEIQPFHHFYPIFSSDMAVHSTLVQVDVLVGGLEHF